VKPHILFVILDWGIGHASRSSVILDQLYKRDLEVSIATSGEALDYLKLIYPDGHFLELPDKKMVYDGKGAHRALLKRALIQKRINHRQHKWIQEMAGKLSVSHIISDNVYGAYVENIPSVLISHQLALEAPLLRKVFNKKIADWINEFDEVWVPDFEEPNCISGRLSVNHLIKKPVKYIGWLSRHKIQISTERDFDCTILLSGVEPQRTILETKLLHIVPNELKIALVRGSEKAKRLDARPNIQVYGLPVDDQLNGLLNRSKYVICRSGYSSIMDLLILGVRATLIPTPGQPEQEYLGSRLETLGWFKKVEQAEISESIFYPDTSHNLQPAPPKSGLNQTIDSFLMRGSE
jgi:uncharacterized protein (TIGR00661 family)